MEDRVPSELQDFDMVRVNINMLRGIHEQLQLRAQLSGSGNVIEFLRRGGAIFSSIVEIALDNDMLAPETTLEIRICSQDKTVDLRTIEPFNSSQFQ